MEYCGAKDDPQYTGFREITDRDVLDLQCNNITLYSFPASGDFCRLLITFANSLAQIWLDKLLPTEVISVSNRNIFMKK